MAGSKRPQVIDGFSSVRAVRHAGKESQEARTRPTRTRLPATENTDSGTKKGVSGTPATRIGHTTTPARYEIECYDCGYAFKLTGRLGKTFCPKCKKELEVGDYTIEEERTEDITTIGQIEVASGGSIKGARFLARDMILAGDIEQAEGHVFGCLELRDGAKLDTTKLKIKDVRIGAGSKINLRRKLHCRNLQVLGELRASVQTDGVLTVKAGGLLRGTVKAPHLVIEDGGGLKAKVTSGEAAI